MPWPYSEQVVSGCVHLVSLGNKNWKWDEDEGKGREVLGVAILFSVKDIPFSLIMKLVMFTQKENKYLKKNVNT